MSEGTAEILADGPAAVDGSSAEPLPRPPVRPRGARTRAYDVASVAFALVLLVAAGLKTEGLLVGAHGRAPAHPNPVSSWAEIVAECFLAAWLLSGFAREWARRASIGLLAVFVTIAVWRMVGGEKDCGCFGRVPVHPAWTLALDVILLLGLCYGGATDVTGAARPEFARMPRLRQYALGILAPLAIAAAVSGILWLLASSGRLPLPGLMRGPSLVSIDPSPKASFKAREGDTVTAKFTVRNITDQPLRLLGATTSCGCTVVATEFPIELRPGEPGTLTVQMHVGPPESDGISRQEARLLTNRDGMVPPLVIEAAVAHH